MNQIDPHEMQQHITILGWLYLIGYALFLAIGAFVFMLLTGIGVAFPIGTVIGVYTFWVLTQPAATEYFATPAPA